MKNNIFIFLLILVILLLFILFDFSIIEKLVETAILKHWWSDSDSKSVDIFNEIFKNSNKKVEIYSVNLKEKINKNRDTIYVQYSGESFYSEPSWFDINFIPAEKEEGNIIVFPHAFLSLLHTNMEIDRLLSKRQPTEKNNFCLFMVSNGSCYQRVQMFNNLSDYKKVDSCGSFMNNMDGNCTKAGFGTPEYFEFIKSYKFMICFENKSQPNYFTEKLTNAYYGGAIPIYWGCSNIGDYVNLDSILYLKPNFSEQDMSNLIKEIIRLDNDDAAYKEKYEKVFFKDGKLPDAFNIDVIRDKVNKLIDNK
jgi:hypothetical protein